MTEARTAAYPATVIGTNGAPGVLMVDTTALINFDRIGSLDTLLAANRTVIITPEVQREAVTSGLASTNPAIFASAQRIDSWIQLHTSLGDVEVKASDPNRVQFAGVGAGENSIRADATFLGASGNGNVVIVSDDNHIALSNVNGSDVPALTGNYYLNSLLLGGGITPNDYFQQTSAGLVGGFNQGTIAGDSSSIVLNGVFYGLSVGGVPRGTYQYTTTGSSSITMDGQTIFFAPYEKGGIQNGTPLKVTDASDGGHIDTLFDTANLQPWFAEAFAYDSQKRNTGITTANDDGTSKQKALNVDGSKPWLSETTSKDADGNVTTVDDVFTNGTTAIKYLDPRNTHPYSELDIDEDASGKITSAKPKIDGQPDNVSAGDFSAVGQVLGSALGRALAPNNQFVQLAAGTVVGAAGQQLAQAFSQSLAANGAAIDLSTVFANFDVSIAGAGASSVASFLIAELGTALHLDGFGGQLFDAAAGGFAGSVASQIATQMAKGATFDVAIAGIQWGNAAASAGYGISSAVGTFLAHQFVQAHTPEGAAGGQLLGAVGSVVGVGLALGELLGGVLDFILPGVGSLIGTVLGTLLGDLVGHTDHPTAVDLIAQQGYLYGFTHYQTAEGGDYGVPDPIAAAAVGIVNAYLAAVKGAALDHSKQVTVGYLTDPLPSYNNGTPGHIYGSFRAPDDAVHAAALDLLQHTEVIGGDLLLKRAHQNSPSCSGRANRPRRQARIRRISEARGQFADNRSRCAA